MSATIDRLSEFTRPTGTETQMDVDFPEPPRFRLSPRIAAGAAGVLLSIIALVLCNRVIQPTSVPPPEQPAITQVSAVKPATEVVVSVVGAVNKPGLVTLEPGARIADALEAAGGAHKGVDPAAVNLAQLVTDGQQIVIPKPGQPVAPAQPGAATGSGISLNTATAAELEELDGVGEATADAIIEYRETNGGFTTIEELMEVSGIGEAKFSKVKDDVTL